jgi:hypothetical protein
MKCALLLVMLIIVLIRLEAKSEAGRLGTKPEYSKTGIARLSQIAKKESAVLPQIGAV